MDRIRPLAATLLLSIACVEACAETGVLEVAKSYPDGGGYNRAWSGSGTPEAIHHEGRRVLAASDGGTYCCGFTYAVAMRVAERRGLLVDKDFDAVKRFQKLWYGATELDDETLVVLAAETLGIGRRIPLADALPGDFVQLWRTNRRGARGSGHSVIFVAWVLEGGEQVGFRYRSSQGSTDGIGEATEYFADAAGHDGRVIRQQTYACRLFNNAAEANTHSTATPAGSGTATDDDPSSTEP